MSVKYGLQSIFLHLDPVSCEIVRSLRGVHHTQFSPEHSATPIAVLYRLVYDSGNREFLERKLKEITISRSPFKMQFKYPFYNYGAKSKLASVKYGLHSDAFSSLYYELYQRLEDALVVVGGYGVANATGCLKHIPKNINTGDISNMPSRPRISIRHGLSLIDASDLIAHLKWKYTTGIQDLNVTGLSLGPMANIQRLTTDSHLAPRNISLAPWAYYPFQGSN